MTRSSDTFVLSSTAPEPGQLVEVRRRQWIVSDVDASAVSPELPKRNLVKLASIDEDALGEEIEVLWELEPGAHVIERAGLHRQRYEEEQGEAPAAEAALVEGAPEAASAGQGAVALIDAPTTTPKTKSTLFAKTASNQEEQAMSKNTGKLYEELTEQVFKRILSAQGGLVANVQRDIRLQGHSTTHQIDVFFEFTAGPISYSTIVQCKDWSSAVKQEQVLAFHSVITDIPGQPRGIIVSRSGFQEGARNVAEHYGIKLYELREPCDEDWDGLLRAVNISLHVRSPNFEDFKPILDRPTIRAQLDALGHQQVHISLSGNPDRMFKNAATDEYIAINKLLNSLVPHEGTGLFHLRHEFKESVVMLTPNAPLPAFPVLGFEATAVVSDIYREVRISVDHLIAYCFKDAFSGEVKFLRADGGPLHEDDEGIQP